MADTYRAMYALLLQDNNITSKLATYEGTSNPLVKGGVLPETEKGLPCIVFFPEIVIPNKSQRSQIFRVNCYAGNTPNMENADYLAHDLAMTVLDRLNGFVGHAGDIPVQVSASLLGLQNDPNTKQAMQPVEVVLTII